MPNAPKSAVAQRKSRSSVRPVVWEVGDETWAPRYSGATSWVVQRWICWRARASVMSEVQTRSHALEDAEVDPAAAGRARLPGHVRECRRAAASSSR